MLARDFRYFTIELRCSGKTVWRLFIQKEVKTRIINGPGYDLIKLHPGANELVSEMRCKTYIPITKRLAWAGYQIVKKN